MIRYQLDHYLTLIIYLEILLIRSISHTKVIQRVIQIASNQKRCYNISFFFWMRDFLLLIQVLCACILYLFAHMFSSAQNSPLCWANVEPSVVWYLSVSQSVHKHCNHWTQVVLMDVFSPHHAHVTCIICSNVPVTPNMCYLWLGINHTCLIVDYPDDKWDEMLAIMLSAPFHFIKRLLPAMQAKG